MRRGVVHFGGAATTVLPNPCARDEAQEIAISSSRPRGGPSPCANASDPFLLGASLTYDADVSLMDTPSMFRAIQQGALQPGELVRPRK